MSGAPHDKDSSRALGEEAWKAFIKQNVKTKLDPTLKGHAIVASELMCRILNRILAGSNIDVTVSARFENNLVHLSPSLYKIFERFYRAHQMNLDRLRKTD
jgi:hypothetical protein